MNAIASRIAFCVLYVFYQFAPSAFTSGYLHYLAERGLIPRGDYLDSGPAHMEDFLSGIGGIMAVVVVLPLFFIFTAGCRRFHFRVLPSRRFVWAYAFRAVIFLWLCPIIASEAVLYFFTGYWPLMASTVAGVVAVVIAYIGVDSARFQSTV